MSIRRPRDRARIFGPAFFVLAALLAAGGAAGELLCETGRPFFLLTTTEGAIRIELAEEAAPKTIRRLVRLAEGPIFNPDLVPSPPAPPTGYYDGLAFDYANPHIEIISELRPPEGLVELANEISAEALALDRSRIDNPGEAMDVMQMELLPAYQAHRKQGVPTGRLGEWIDKWYESYQPDFLVGVTRQQINEALGHAYEKGLASLPPIRGAVGLAPSRPGHSTPRLSILLSDIPQRNGRWMVIGRVVEGLELAQDISLRDRVPGPYGDRFHRPLVPVVIESLEFECRADEGS